MKKLILISALLFTTSCTTSYLSHMSQCGDVYTGLEETVTCAKKSRMEYCETQDECSAEGNEFYAYADYLVYIVNTNQMAEEQAKYLLEQKFSNAVTKRNQGIGMMLGAASDAFAGRQPSYSKPATQPQNTQKSLSYDYDWDWDGFYNANGDWVWMCRGIQTGQFATPDNCRGDFKTDYRWHTPRKTGDY
jgi:hypothetical protein